MLITLRVMCRFVWRVHDTLILVELLLQANFVPVYWSSVQEHTNCNWYWLVFIYVLWASRIEFCFKKKLNQEEYTGCQ